MDFGGSGRALDVKIEVFFIFSALIAQDNIACFRNVCPALSGPALALQVPESALAFLSGHGE